MWYIVDMSTNHMRTDNATPVESTGREQELARDTATAFIHLEALDRKTLAAADPPLTPAQYHALVALSSVPAQSLNGLAARLLCDKANASKMMDRLSALGLATRTADPADARRVVLCLTPAGRAALDRATGLRVAALRGAFAPLQSDELRAMSRQLATLVALLRLAADDTSAQRRAPRPPDGDAGTAGR